MRIHKALLALPLAGALAGAGTLFCGGYPNVVMVIDEATGKITDTIKLETGLPRSLRLSADKKSIFISTNDHAGFEVLDVATRKITSSFVLDDATHRYRINGGAPDPEGKKLYASTIEFTKKPDRYEVGKQMYSIIDLEQKKIVKNVEIPQDPPRGGGNATPGALAWGGRTGFEVSPDGKYLYQFGPQVTVLSADDFKVVEKIDLGQPGGTPMENLGLGGLLDALSQPGQRVSVFTYSDPIVHNRVFGLGRFDLNTRKFEFTTLGPAPISMSGLYVTPDQKMGYTMTSQGTHGNIRCEFLGIDLSTSKLTRTAEVPCRTRYNFGMSSDGKKLYIYAAGFEIDVYDTVTFKHEGTWTLDHDMTGPMIVLP